MILPDKVINRFREKEKIMLLNREDRFVAIITDYFLQNMSRDEIIKSLAKPDSPESKALNEIVKIYCAAEDFADIEETSFRSNIPLKELDYISTSNDFTRLKNALEEISLEKRILIKPNLVSGEDYPETSSIDTIREIALAVAPNAKELIIGDGPSFFFHSEIAIKRAQKEFPEIKCVDFNLEPYVKIRREEWKILPYVEVPEMILSFDHLINLCNLKEHTEFGYSSAKKNLMGLVSPATRLMMHRLPKEKRIEALNELSEILQPQIVIMDAREIMLKGQQKRYGGIKGPGFGKIYSTDIEEIERESRRYLKNVHI